MNCLKCGIKMETTIQKQCNDNNTTIQIKAKCKSCGNEYYSDEFENETDYEKSNIDL